MLDNYINPEKYSGVAKDSTINSAKEEILEAVDGAMGTLFNKYDEAVSAQLSMLTEDDNPTAQGQVSSLRTLVGQTAGLIEQGNTLADALGKVAMAQEILKGKEELVNVINAMGGHVSIGDSFTTLAHAIENDIELLDPRTTFTEDMVYPINLATYAAQPRLLSSRIEKLYSEVYDLTAPYTYMSGGNAVKEIYLPNLEVVTSSSNAYFSNCTSLEILDISKLAALPTTSNRENNSFVKNCTNLIDLITGKNFTSNQNFYYCNYAPTTAYSKATNSLCYDDDIEKYGQIFETNWHKWKWCIINHFAANLTDLTGLDSFTITFGATVLAQFDEEMVAAFTNKNWTLA